MLMLALDTSSSAITVALYDGESVLAEHTDRSGTPRHGEVLAPAIQRLVESGGVAITDLTDIAVGVGPGPFTGLRIGLVTARVLGFTLGIPVHGVCSLDVLAADADLEGEFLVAADARRREVYFARYASPLHRLTDPAVDKPDVVAAAHVGIPVVGEGGVLYPDAFPVAFAPTQPSAATLGRVAAARLRDGALLLAPDPLYLRRPDATPQPPRTPATAS